MRKNKKKKKKNKIYTKFKKNNKRRLKKRKLIFKKKKNKKKRTNQKLIIEKEEESFILKLIRFQEQLKPRFNFKISFNLKEEIQRFFDKILYKIKEYKIVKEREKR